MNTLDISRAALDSIVAHARLEAPNECCGLLVGQGSLVTRVVETRNASESPRTRYRIDPRDHFAVIRALRGGAAQIVGAYHSHPTSPAAFSPTDVAEAWPSPFVYVIVSLKDASKPEVKAYTMENGNPLPVALRAVRDG